MAKSRKRQTRQSQPGRPLPLPLLAALGGVLLLGLLTYWRANAPAGLAGGAGQPNLVVDREVIDFGNVRLGQWVSASFTLTNTGARPLRFIQPPYIEVVEGC